MTISRAPRWPEPSWLDPYPPGHRQLLLAYGVPPLCHERGFELNTRLIELAEMRLPPASFEWGRHLLFMELLGDDPHVRDVDAAEIAA